MTHQLEHQMLFDYIPFIILLGSLFIITGGIHLKGDIAAKPATNVGFLAIGAILASFMGTTGAAMLLIRPVIKTNSERKFKVHTILFFIAIVANCGGMLTPLGDPPLFLLYLRDAPFEWFFKLTPEWAFANFLLIVIYYITDNYYYKKEPLINIHKDQTQIEPIRITGTYNFIFLLGIIGSVAFLNQKYYPTLFGFSEETMSTYPELSFIREAVMLFFAGLSLYFTPRKLRLENKFTWTPIIEVAFLFLGIFITMVPTLQYLRTHADQLGVDTVPMFYYATGALSSFLDNAPTALVFHGLATMIPVPEGMPIVAGIAEEFLKAISVGAVFFGAMTYIGNGPNFMVKAIAEENKIPMPSFFGYMFKFSLIVLLPIYILTQWLFL